MRKNYLSLFFLLIGLLTSAAQDDEVAYDLVKTLWSQEDTSYNNYRIPSIIVSKENTILAFAEGREGGDTGNIDILVKRSKDNGRTWSEESVVWDDGNNTCGNPTALIDQESGRIILFATWNLGEDHEHDIIRKTSKSRRIPYMMYSDDDGRTWSDAKRLPAATIDEDWGWYATGPGIAIQMESEQFKNRIVVPCNHSYTAEEVKNRDGKGYGAHVLYSDDSGETWQRSQQILPEVNESQIVELNDGSLLMNMRSYNGNSRRAISRSRDGGKTWSEITFDDQLVEPICQASLLKYKSSDSSFYLFSNPASQSSREKMTIKMSLDDMESWKFKKMIYRGPSAYSCLTKLPNGNIGIFFEAGAKSPYERMVFASFKPEELKKSGILIKDLER